MNDSHTAPQPSEAEVPFACDALRCDNLADWAYIGEGGDLFLCELHGGTAEMDGWKRITHAL